MSHPLLWPTKPYFHPIGAASAFLLTQDLAPEQPADILLLGCGDPRHILFTLFADVVDTSKPRKLDVTCCDIEPAVLARNILLFTLLEDHEPIDQVWNIFYHFKIDDHASEILTHQSQKLYVNAQDIVTWRQSHYGSFLRFVDTRTLTELRRYWKSFAEFPQVAPNFISKLRKDQNNLFQSDSADSSHNKSASHATGILWAQALSPLNNLFKRYWATGVLCDKDSSAEDSTKLNPTFIYSSFGEALHLHPGTFPQGFHITSAMVPIHSDVSNGAAPGTETAILNTMKQQFQKWAEAFHASREKSSLILRFFVGDALAFCRALDIFASNCNPSTGVFASPWHAAQINFDELSASAPPAPISFDVIETSDLADHLGLFNLLLATRPLLKEHPTSQSVLYTETALSAGKEPIRPFLGRIFTTIPTFSALFGMTPRAYVSGFTTHFNIHEALSPQHADHYYERVVWTNPSSGDHNVTRRHHVSFDAKELSRTVFKIYDMMFAPEQVMMITPTGGGITMPIPLRCHRETLAMLWKFVQRRVNLVNGYWEMVMENFQGHYENAWSPLAGGVYTEDLRTQLHLHSVHTIAPLKKDWRVGWAASNSSGVFRDWPDVPSLLCVTFTVPRKSLRVLLDDKKAGGATLECYLGYPSEGHTYTAVHAIWGRCVTLQGSDDLTLEEDEEGMNGKSDLVIMFWATTRLLEFPAIDVALRLKKTPHSMQEFTSKLGKNLQIFSAKVEDKKHVRFKDYRPALAAEDRLSLDAILTSVLKPMTTNDMIPIVADVIPGMPSQTNKHVISFTAQVNFSELAAQKALENGTKVIAAQISPCAMKVSIGAHHHTVTYPYPILGSQHKLRIEKKFHSIEITAPVSQPLDSGGYFLDPTPIALNDAYTSWNIHHVSPDRMPQLDLETPKKLDWLYSHTAMQFSDREHKIRNASSAAKIPSVNISIKVKDSIRTLVMGCSGVKGTRTRIFSLCKSEPSGVYAYLLVGGLRLDLASFTIIIDAALIPLSKEQAPSLTLSVQKLQEDKSIVQVVTDGPETLAWKKTLPAFVERCRTWSHTPNCEYSAQVEASASAKKDQVIICTCGRGFGFEGPEWKVAAWQDVLPFATRVAISPLFGVSFIEYGAGTGGMVNMAQPGAGSGIRTQTKWDNACWICGGGGNPTLAACSRCKKAKYCSVTCQGLDWKAHKKSCRRS